MTLTASPDARALRWSRFVRGYYLATPLFAALDLGWGINVRTAFLAGLPGLRIAYYVVAFGCGLAVRRWPRQAAQAALVESGTNIALLVLGVGAAYLSAIDAAANGGPMPDALTPAAMANVALSAAVLGASHIANQARLVAERATTA